METAETPSTAAVQPFPQVAEAVVAMLTEAAVAADRPVPQDVLATTKAVVAVAPEAAAIPAR